MKIVGITCGTQTAGEDHGHRQTLNTAYVRAIEAAGGVPLLIPNTGDTALLSRYLEAVDGLLLTGGVDVQPSYFGQPAHPALGETDADRDATELPLIPLALARDLPILAICRGIQTLNVALGGTLIQDLPSQHPSDIEHVQSKRGLARSEFSHSIVIQPDTRLREIIGREEMPINSFHHQALESIGKGLVVTAHAPDGVIEAAEMPGQRWVLAVQFHPEETAARDALSRRLFEAFIGVL